MADEIEIIGDIEDSLLDPKAWQMDSLILLDTHVWVWLAIDPKRLSRRAATAIRRVTESGGIFVASISLWELAMLFAHSRLRAPGTVESGVRSVVEKTSVIIHEITPEIAALAPMFPETYPQDPTDRRYRALARTASRDKEPAHSR